MKKLLLLDIFINLFFTIKDVFEILAHYAVNDNSQNLHWLKNKMSVVKNIRKFETLQECVHV
jgi:hypothetical protein